MKRKLFTLIMSVCLIFTMIPLSAYAEEYDAVLKIVPNQTSFISDGNNEVEIEYTISVIPNNGIKIGSISFYLVPPEGMTLGTEEDIDYSVTSLLYNRKLSPDGIFETFPGYDPNRMLYTATGTTEDRCITAEQELMTIKAKVAADKIGEVSLGVNGLALGKVSGDGNWKSTAAVTPVAISKQLSNELSVSITAPVKNATPQTEITDADGKFAGTISWNGTLDKFAAGTEYTADVTLTAAEGYIFGQDFRPTVESGKVSNIVISNDGKTATFKVKFAATASKDTPKVKTAPTASVTYGDAVNNSAIQGGEMMFGETVVHGSFEWKSDVTTYGDAGTRTLKAIFTPTDENNYQSVDVLVNVTVARKAITSPTIEVEGTCEYKGGAAVTPTKVTVKDGDIIIPDTEYTLSYENNTKAGTATVTVVDNGTGNYTLEGNLTQNYIINQINGTLILNEPASIIYDGNAVTCGASDADITYSYTGDGTVKVKWYSDANGSKGSELSAAPTNAGTYWVGISAIAGTNYKAIEEQTLEFTITGKTIDETVKAAVKGYNGTYDGQPHDAVTVAVDKTAYTLKYKTSVTGTYGDEMPTVTNVSDSKTVYVEISRDNYQTAVVEVNAEVNPATITAATVETEKTYTGSLLTFDVTEVKAGELTLSAGDYSVSGNTATNAGENYKMTISGKGNFAGSIEKAFKVSPATITNNDAFTNYEEQYDGNSHGIGFDSSKLSTAGNQRATVKYGTEAGNYTLTTTPKYTDFTNGAKTVYWQVTAPNHETLIGYNTVNIKKARIDVSGLTWGENAEFNFNGKAQKVMLQDVPSGINVKYTDNEKTYVGTYTAKAVATAKDSKNYEITGTIIGKDWTIKSIDQKPSITAARSMTKGGNKLDLTTLVSGAQGTVSFEKVSGDAATLDGTVLTTAADKTGDVILNVKISAKDLNNDGTNEYNAYSKDKAIKITVTDKEAKSLAVNQSGWTYGDASKSPTYKTLAGVQNTVIKYTGTAKDGTTITNSTEVPTKAGEYTVTVSCETATEIYTGEASFAIAQKFITGAEVTLGTALTYNKATQTQTVAGVKLGDTDLAAATDYTVSGNTGTNAGSYTLTISGQNNYTGTVTKSFTIAQKELTITAADVEGRAYVPGQKDVTINEVSFGSDVLTKGVDYRASGTMTDDATGTKAVTVSVELWNNNYKLAKNTFEATATILKATYGAQEISTTVSKGARSTYDISKYLKPGYFIANVTTTNDAFANVPEVKEGKVSYTATAAGTITIKVESTNYADYEIRINVNVAEKPVPELKVSDIEVSYTGTALTTEAIEGTATYGGKNVVGTWTFGSADLTSVNDGINVTVTFTPESTEEYSTAVTTIKVTINKAKVTGTPKITAVTAEGKTLGDIKAEASKGFGVDGTFEWIDGDNAPIKNGAKYTWRFTPDDSNYETLTGTVTPWTSGGTGGGGGGFPIIIPVDNPEQTAKDFIKDNLTVNGQVIKAADANNYTKILEAVDKYNKLTDAEKAAVDKELKAQGSLAFADLTAAAQKIETEAAGTGIEEKVKNTVLKTKSKLVKLNGKKAIKISWYIAGGELKAEDFDGFSVYRSVKKNKGYGKKAYFTTTKLSYTNSKALKAGKTYYYKVRAFKLVDGKKLYTPYSTKAWRKIK